MERSVSQLKTTFNTLGFLTIPAVLESKICEDILNCINKRIRQLIIFHQCSESLYFSAVNRWPLLSLVDSQVYENIVTSLTECISSNFEGEWQVFEVDVLYKSAYAPLATVCHQDISYAFKKPYSLSIWLALTDSGESSLRFLPGSHTMPIEPAVDFWKPDFVDTFVQSLFWQEKSVRVPIQSGDALVFSSKIWHGSDVHWGENDRVALVIRFRNAQEIYPHIPFPEKVPFGLWNCGEYTQAVLEKALKYFFDYQPIDYDDAIRQWRNYLPSKKIACLHLKNADLALEKLQVLNQASVMYGGGDSQGIVYPDVWKALLNPLNNYLANTES